MLYHMLDYWHSTYRNAAYAILWILQMLSSPTLWISVEELYSPFKLDITEELEYLSESICLRVSSKSLIMPLLEFANISHLKLMNCKGLNQSSNRILLLLVLSGRSVSMCFKIELYAGVAFLSCHSRSWSCQIIRIRQVEGVQPRLQPAFFD